MKYLKKMKSDGYDIVLAYDDGREQAVSENQDLYLQWLANGNQPEVIPYVAPVVETEEECRARICSQTIYGKLAIRRAMRALGQEEILDALLQNEQFRKDWDDATEIDLSDPLVVQALAQAQIDTDSIKLKIYEMNT